MTLRRGPAVVRPILAAALAASVAFSTAAAASLRLDAREQAGRRIYREGVSPSGGEITAIIGGSVLPATTLPCASCHGRDGLGRREGGVDPSDVTWAALTKSYGHAHENGRRHPPFDSRSLARAVLEGVDPAGNTLDPAMPRYSMSRADLESLEAYLKRLAQDVDPGIRADALVIASVVPARGRLAETGGVIRRSLELSVEAVNARGGIHGRRLALALAEYDSDGGSGVGELEKLLAKTPAFAVVAPFTPRDEPGVLTLSERLQVPVVGPITPFTPAPGSASANVFYVLGGLREEARVLAAQAARELTAPARVVVLHPRDALSEIAGAARDELTALGLGAGVLPYAPGGLGAGLAASGATRTADAVLLLGGDADLAELARAVQDEPRSPLLLVPGTLAARAALDAAPTLRGRIRVAFPMVPGERGADARAVLARVASERRLGPGERHGAISAHVAFAVLAEGLRRAGRQLSRDGFVEKIERLQRFDAGVGPPLSYGPARRIGALGAYVMSPASDGSGFQEAGGWVGLE